MILASLYALILFSESIFWRYTRLFLSISFQNSTAGTPNLSGYLLDSWPSVIFLHVSSDSGILSFLAAGSATALYQLIYENCTYSIIVSSTSNIKHSTALAMRHVLNNFLHGLLCCFSELYLGVQI